MNQVPKKKANISTAIERKGPFFSGTSVFPKLKINKADDQFEKEADATADRVMRFQESPSPEVMDKNPLNHKPGDQVQNKAKGPNSHTAPTNATSPPVLQTKKNTREEEQIQKEELEESEESTSSTIDIQRMDDPTPNESRSAKDSNPRPIYPKLSINAPNDPMETEADQMADQVMRKTEMGEETQDAVTPALSLANTAPEGLQLKCQSCSAEELWRKNKKEDSDSEMPDLMRKSSDGDLAASPELQQQLTSSKGSGTPLPPQNLDFMNQAFGRDFSTVRIHTNSKAADMSQGIQAKAFTHGSDIYFNSGQYSPNTSQGKHLLAHELSHVVQQKGGQVQPKVQRKPTNNPPLNSRFFDQPYFRAINEDDKYVLKRGHQNDHVKILQQALLDLKYPLPKFKDDGKFGKETRRALKSFQQDIGFEGEDVDGILGHKTLRKLDTRFAASNKKKYVSSGSGKYVLIRIFVSRTYEKGNFEDMKELAILQLQAAFKNLSRDEANKMVPQNEAEVAAFKAGQRPSLVWWEKFGGVSKEEKETGYVDTGLAKSIYDEYRNRAERVRGKKKDPEEVEKETRASLYKLQGSKKIYQLYKEITLLKQVLTYQNLNLASFILDSFEESRRYLGGDGKLITTRSDLQADLTAKQKVLNQELAKLGITEEEFFKNASAFRKNFQTYAVLTALRMLDRNETKTRVAAGQLRDLKNVQEIKTIIRQLNGIYAKAEEAWWKGVSKELTKDYQITSHEKLNEIINQGIRGAKGIPFLGGVITSTDAAYRLFAIYRYKDGKHSLSNEHFKAAQAFEQAAHLILAAGAQKYNILAYPDLDLKGKGPEYVTMGDTELQGKLQSFIADSGKGVLANIGKMKTAIQNDPEKIWELKPVWTQALRELGLSQEDPQYQIIEAEVKKRKDEKFLRDILLAVGGIALGLLALASGPVGWAALAGSIVVGSIDAYIQYQEISFLRSARRTALDPKDALSDVDPSWVWFYLSLAGIGLDFLDVVKVIKVANTVRKADNLVAKVGADLSEEVTRLKGLGKLDEAAKIEKLLENLEANKAVFAQNLKILLKLESDPAAMLRLSEAMAKPEVAQAMTQLAKHLGDTSAEFMAALKFYGGIGNELADELPEVLKIIKQGNLKAHPELMQQVLSQPPIQKVLLDHPQEADLLARQWRIWDQAGRTTTFVKHLQKAGFDTNLSKGSSIVMDFGKGFAELPDLAKNRQLLRHFEPKLMDALDAGHLPPQVQETILLHLSDDLIGQTDDLARAGHRLREVIAPLIGGELKSNAEFAELAKMISDPAFLKKIFDHAPNLPGKDTYARILQELIRKHQPDPEVLDQLARIGVVTDKGTLELLMTNKALRETLAQYPEAAKLLKKCASPCFPAGLSGDQIVKINQLLNGKSLNGDQFRRLNEYIYLHRGILENGQFDKFYTHLSAYFDLIKDGQLSRIPKTDLLVDPAKLTALGLRMSSADATKIANSINTAFSSLLAKTSQDTLRSIVQRGIPEDLLTDILTTASAKGFSADQAKVLIEQLNRAAGIAFNGEMRQLGKVFYGLGDAKTFDQAASFLDMMRTYNRSHADMFDDILTRLDWADFARFPVPSGVQAPYYYRVVAHFKQLIDDNILQPAHIEVLAKKLAKPGSGGIDLDDLLEFHRVISSASIRRVKYMVEFLQSKLLNVNQNLKQFINDELKNKTIRAIMDKIRSVQPSASLESALKVTLKDPDLSFFNSLPKGTKRLAILANTEPELAVTLEKLLYNTTQLETQLGKTAAGNITLDPSLQAKLISTLENIPIPNPANAILGTIRGKVVDQVNEILGKNLDIADIRKLDSLLEQQGTRGSVFEHWVRQNFVDPNGTIASLSGKTPPFENVQGAATSAKNIQIDSHTVLTKGQQKILVGLEIKHVSGKLTGEPLQQLYRYKELMTNPGNYKSGGITYNQVQLRYLFSTIDAAKDNKALIRAELGPNAVIYYVNKAGQIVALP